MKKPRCGCIVVKRSINRNGERHLNRSPSIGIWQAYHPPASLRAQPLSLPAACGRYEIYHLKCLSYPMLIIAFYFAL
nr:MAG TPA: hypothetical protein [Bacteriophage sp.]